jgi:hypothetical protein
VLELRDQATAIPKLDVVTVNEAPGVFFRDPVAKTYQIDRANDAPVQINNIGSIIGQLRLDFPGADAPDGSGESPDDGRIASIPTIYTILGIIRAFDERSVNK